MMNSNISTSIEQSKKLIVLGIDVKTADMFWSLEPEVLVASEYMSETNLVPCVKAIPAWSLSALLGLMPYHMSGIPKRAAYHLTLKKYKEHWECCYEHFSFGEIYTQKGNTQFEAAYNMMCWLLENKNIKTEQQ